jgi:hypothetical protein
MQATDSRQDARASAAVAGCVLCLLAATPALAFASVSLSGDTPANLAINGAHEAEGCMSGLQYVDLANMDMGKSGRQDAARSSKLFRSYANPFADTTGGAIEERIVQPTLAPQVCSSVHA